MLKHKAARAETATKAPEQPDRLVSMSEAMEYLTDNGYPCRSRHSFYRTIDLNNIPYVNTNPTGKNEMRRFTLTALNEFLATQGLRR